MNLSANERQPWTNSHDYYFEYLIIHFDYLIIQFDYLIIGENTEQIPTCSGKMISPLENHFCDSKQTFQHCQ